MPEWTEKEIADKKLMAPCGLYCGTCGVYIATRDNNEKFKVALGGIYGTRPEETECLGCMQADPPEKLYAFCRACTIRECVKKRATTPATSATRGPVTGSPPSALPPVAG